MDRSFCAAPLALFAIIFFSGCDTKPSDAVPDDQPDVPAPIQRRLVLKVGDPAPNFKLRDLNGQPVSLSEYRGAVVFINFWATWCGPCRVEMPAMESLYRLFDRHDFEILAVSTDAQGVSVTKPFKKEMGLSFPILHDSDYRVGLAYGARTLPMTFLIDRRGIIVHKIFGARDWQSPEAKELIQTVLNSK